MTTFFGINMLKQKCWFLFKLPYLPSVSWKLLGVFWKIQEICSKLGTNLFEIDEEMPEIIDAKVGNPQNSTSMKSANLSQP